MPPRTLAGFVAASVAVVAMAGISYWVLQKREEITEGVAQAMEATTRLAALKSTVKDGETGQRGYLLTGDAHFLEPYEMAVVTLPSLIVRARAALANDPESQQRFEALQRLIERKMAELKQTVDLTRDGQTDKALAIVRTGQGRELMDRVRAEVDTLVLAERRILDARTDAYADVVTLSTAVNWSGSALLLFLIIGAAVISAREFREQKVQAWLRAGQNELGARLQGEQTIAALGDNVTGYLAGYLGAQVGAIYTGQGEGALRRVGGYALPPEVGEPRPVKGLALQAIQEQTLLEIGDAPHDYIPVSSGLGEVRPRHIVLAPTSAGGAGNGVIELGFVRPVERPALELLRRIGEPVGIALRTARYRSDLERLLEETRAQAEELQAQQEELRVSNEELEQQSNALQESAHRQQNQQAELEQLNSQLAGEVHTVERQRDDILRAQGALQRASAYKSEFLANMSHELRTPLNSSLILAKLLAENRDGNLSEEQIKFAETIYAAGNDLLTLINDILDISKIEAGKLEIRLEHAAVARMVDELQSTFLPMAQERRLAFEVGIEPGTPAMIYNDPRRVQQILKNLLSNALKFTESGGVTLTVRGAGGEDGRLAFEVRDTGIGIASEQHDAIFEAFRQADGTINRRFGGTGLGLSISRELARLLGGELTVESTPGRGSTFTLYLPQSHAPAEVAPTPLAPGLVAPPAPAAALPPAAVPAYDDRARIPPGARAILIVEDDLAFSRIVADLAHELSFQVLVAQSAAEGQHLAERYRPSGIVLDIGLPDRSGLALLEILKRNPATRHIPAHVISAFDYTRAALHMGAAGYALKPVQREQLVAALKRLESKFTQKVRRVLIVEDDEVHRAATASLLAADDVETVAVGTSSEALARLGAQTFDCMVLDLSLPDGTGYDLLVEMSHKEQYSFPPVIVYTGRSLSPSEEQELRRFSESIIIKGARSPERLLDEVTLFLHKVESDLPPDRQRMLRDVRHRESAFENRRVLVVEDDVRTIFALSSLLEPRGAKIEVARNGREALVHLRENPGVDLVLMDIMMPEMDGLEATREIRKVPGNANLPIIALTAKAMADDRASCLAAGANDYIAKPLDVDKLLSVARVWMPK